jgi:LAO/AO transport system kinase
VLLQLPNAGDDLQAIKKGIMELADLVVFNKADIDPTAAQMAATQMRSALGMLRSSTSVWRPPVLSLSAVKKEGIETFWHTIEDFRAKLIASGDFAARRRHQALAWMWQQIEDGLHARFREHAGIKAALPELSRAVADGSVTPSTAAHRLLAMLNRFF